MDIDVKGAKDALRQEMMTRRASISPEEATQAGLAICDQLAQLSYPREVVCSLYWSIKREIDAQPMLSFFAQRGATLCLPVTVSGTAPLLFRCWAPGEPLVRGGFGTRIPEASAPEMIPNVMIVPLLAFTRRGGRLGYGKGHFDRTIQGLRARGDVLVVGVAYAFQEVEVLPLEQTDEPLDWILTPQNMFNCRGEEEGGM